MAKNTLDIVSSINTVEVNGDENVTVDIIEEIVTIELGTSGPQGPKGDPGGIGEGAVSYIHVQNAPLDTWTITHSLSFIPNVTIVDSAGTTVEGTVEYPNSTTVVLRFSGAFSGKAYLS